APPARNAGLAPAVGSVCADAKAPSPLPSSTETVLDPRLATARSSLPSPLKSPTATENGLVPTARSGRAANVPSPWPRSTETVPEPSLATARSALPSPLKSPTATDDGLCPVRKSLGATNDIVWACAGLSNADDQRNVATTGRESLAALLVTARAHHAARPLRPTSPSSG